MTFLIKNLDEITCYNDSNALFQTKNVLKKYLEFIFHASYPFLNTYYYLIVRSTKVFTFQILEYTRGSEEYLTWSVRLDYNFVDWNQADFSVD